MDTSGIHLHKRGYGIFKEDAPLRETVACAMLQSVGWNETTFQLHDPMCGSGTIAIEAALLAKRIPLCEYREFAFQKWQSFDIHVYDKVRHDLLKNIVDNPPVKITASDIDEKAIASARANAQKAGIDIMIDFRIGELHENTIDKNCCVVTNPPWGKRITSDNIRSVWMHLQVASKRGQAVYLILPEIQERIASFKYRTILRFESGGLKVKFIKLEA
jgi:23S rRNA G2445 N2-methylase RlmL